jgi:hypothetical protein
MKIFSNSMINHLSEKTRELSHSLINLNLKFSLHDLCKRSLNVIKLDAYIQFHPVLLDLKTIT